jgi:DNA-binding CsgD family transcriptional regulator
VLTEFIDPGRQRQIADAIRTNTSAANFAAANKAAEATDVSDLLGAVCAPTLILFDSTFPFASFDLCRRVASGIPNARLVMMHESFMIGPRHEQTVATIEQFLREGVISEQPVEPVSYARATLTQREREVLRLIAAGHANKTIASQLGMSERTAARHITNLYAKIGAHSKAAATAYAIRNKLT